MDADEIDALSTYTGESANLCSIDDPELQRSARPVVMALGCLSREVRKVVNSVLEQVLVEFFCYDGFVV